MAPQLYRHTKSASGRRSQESDTGRTATGQQDPRVATCCARGPSHRFIAGVNIATQTWDKHGQIDVVEPELLASLRPSGRRTAYRRVSSSRRRAATIVSSPGWRLIGSTAISSK